MKLFLAALALTIGVAQTASAMTNEERNEAIQQLAMAQSELNTIRALIPGILRNSVGTPLNNIAGRIQYVQNVLGTSTVGGYFCTMDSAFDGSFSGRGATELEASTAAKQACQVGSRGNGIHCRKNSLTCAVER